MHKTEQINEALSYIEQLTAVKPTIGIILGSGLGLLRIRLTMRFIFRIMIFRILQNLRLLGMRMSLLLVV